MIFTINAPKKLKKCPWCKETPKLFKEKLYSNERNDYYEFYVKCENPKCKIQPKTHPTGIYVNAYSSIPINEACNDWNDGLGENDEKE